MFRKALTFVVVLLALTLLAPMAAVQASDEAATGDVVVRVFMDKTNDMHDKDDFGLKDWTVELSGITPKLTATTGPNGFASFKDLDLSKTYTVRVTPPNDGFRLARSNAQPAVQPKGNRVFVAAPAYQIQPGDFQSRKNGDAEAWVRFSTIRVNRITVSNVPTGETIEVQRASDGRPVNGMTDTAGPNGFATFVGGGLFYEQTFNVVNLDTGESVQVTIPYSWQPKVDWATLTCKDCTYP